MTHTASRRKPDLMRDLNPKERHKIIRRGEERKQREHQRGITFPEPGEDVELVHPSEFVHPTKRPRG